VPTPNNPPARRHSPLLCYVTDRRSLPVSNVSQQLPALLQKIEELAAAGVDWIQLREKDLSARDLAALIRQALQIVAEHSPQRQRTRILVNDRVDVAMAERAGGAHLGEQSLPVAETRRLIQSAQATGSLPDDFLFGVSCHSVEAAEGAEAGGADYIFFGPIFATPSKAKFGLPQGLERLREVCSSVSLPVLAIGGITLENAKSCIEAGAAGLAAIGLFQDARDPASAVQPLRQLATEFRRQQLPADRRERRRR
jgi:thiamine-phosphate pyrophosphorylase